MPLLHRREQLGLATELVIDRVPRLVDPADVGKVPGGQWSPLQWSEVAMGGQRRCCKVENDSVQRAMDAERCEEEERRTEGMRCI